MPEPTRIESPKDAGRPHTELGMWPTEDAARRRFAGGSGVAGRFVRGSKRFLTQVADRSGLWPAIAGGCHPARDTTEAITAAGFEIDEIERFGFSAQRFEPSIPHVLGRARRSQ